MRPISGQSERKNIFYLKIFFIKENKTKKRSGHRPLVPTVLKHYYVQHLNNNI